MKFLSLFLSWIFQFFGLLGLLLGLFGLFASDMAVPLFGFTPIVMLLVGLVLLLIGVWFFGRYARASLAA
ncbi:MAG: hypothetical protein KIS91_16405 [Anaerolineae bacterium]|nr:hypothetical protein [Anaerolineae bacterium]